MFFLSIQYHRGFFSSLDHFHPSYDYLYFIFLFLIHSNLLSSCKTWESSPLLHVAYSTMLKFVTQC